MKRHLLTVAIAAATLLPLTAQAAPSVYGRLNLSVDYSDVDTGVDGKVWELNSNSSRVGIRGNEKLNEEFTAVYKAEWGFDADMSGELSARERYIGLKHFQWGAIRLGYIDSPFKNAEDDVDVFNDSVNLDMSNFLTGQNRLANSINYVSPKFLDVFGANISLQPGEQDRDVNENHIADGISAAFSYEDDSLYLSFAMDKEIESKLPDTVVGLGVGATLLPPVFLTTSYSEARDAMRLNARYKLGDATLSAMFQQSEASNNLNTFAEKLDEEAIVLSGSYKMDAVTLRGQIAMSNFDLGQNFVIGSDEELETTLIGVGLDYNFTSNTKAFANLAVLKIEATVAGATANDVDGTFLGFGMETRF